MAARVTVERDGRGRLVVRKEPLASGHGDLRAEADWLRRAAGPGVVEVVDDASDEGRLTTIHAGAHTLRTAAPSPDQAAPLVASLLRVLASLHRRGLVHGALGPDHLVLAAGGVVLCSPAPGATDPQLDRQAVVEVIDAARERWGPAAVAPAADRTWRRATELLLRPAAGWSLDDIADLLDPMPAAAPRRRRLALPARRAPGVPAAALVVVVVVVAVAAVAALQGRGGSAPAVGGAADTGTAVAATAVAPSAPSGPVAEVAGARYRGDRPGHRLAVTDRPCPEAPAAGVLDPASGTVWSAGRLPRVGEALATHAVQQVPGAVDVVARPEGPCERILVVGPAGEAPVPMPQVEG